MRVVLGVFIGTLLLACRAGSGQGPDTRPATQAAKLPHVQVDVARRQVRVRCEAVNAPAPLEFLLCAAGGAEHETVLRSSVKASHLHLALLMIGLKPGHPARTARWGGTPRAPDGPELQIWCEFEKDGQTVRMPAQEMMRRIKTKEPLGPVRWVFAGSALTEEGRYAADATGYLVSAVNFDYSVIDVGELRSNANETLEWEVNPHVAPPRGSEVWLVIEPAGVQASR